MRAEYYNSEEEKIVLPDDDNKGQSAQCGLQPWFTLDFSETSQTGGCAGRILPAGDGNNHHVHCDPCPPSFSQNMREIKF